MQAISFLSALLYAFPHRAPNETDAKYPRYSFLLVKCIINIASLQCFLIEKNVKSS